jgi:5-methyltetrahydrofolate--homocysteine methyltransferase
MSRFLESLHSGRVLLMDGAMGTELQRAGIPEGECYELWNLTHPERVRAIHQAYVDAGAEVLLTNTFQANPLAFARRGLDSQLELIGQTSVQLARSVAGPDRFVLADIGPIGKVPYRSLAAMLGGLRDADALLVETASNRDDLMAICKCIEAERLTGLPPILFSWTFQRMPDGTLRTWKGTQPGLCARRLRQSGNVALGVNCGRDIGMDAVIEIVRSYRAETDRPLFIRPNAGTPVREGDRWVYPHTPQQMAERLPELLEAGVSMVGGCCGTTPEHIAAFREVVDKWNERMTSPKRKRG